MDFVNGSTGSATAVSSGSDPHGTAKRRVAYFYDNEVGNYHYGQGHPMKVGTNLSIVVLCNMYLQVGTYMYICMHSNVDFVFCSCSPTVCE